MAIVIKLAYNRDSSTYGPRFVACDPVILYHNLGITADHSVGCPQYIDSSPVKLGDVQPAHGCPTGFNTLDDEPGIHVRARNILECYPPLCIVPDFVVVRKPVRMGAKLSKAIDCY